MSTSPERGPANGSLSPVADQPTVSFVNGDDSDSDLSDVQPADVEEPSPDPSDGPDSVHGDAKIEAESDDASETSNNHDGLDDGDFDLAESLASGHSDRDRDERAPSSGSQRAPKRKAGQLAEDEYMRNDPELYGLRRSSRPTQARKLATDSNDSDSDSVPVRQNRRTVKKRRLERSQPSSKRETPARQTSADDSDSDNYGGARARSFQKKARRQQVVQPTQAYAEKRWSSRRAAHLSAGAYQETDMEEEEDADATPNNWPGAEADDSPYIEKIIRHRPREGVELSPDSTRNDFEYYIKWQGKSHIHDTWETMESVAGFRGFRRLENYHRKFVEYELDMTFGGDDFSPEQREQWLLDRERDEEAYADFTNVERVVAVRDNGEGDEYFIKWKGLQYDECTWEDSSMVASRAQDKIDQFLDRASRSWQSDRTQATPGTRPRVGKLDKQPSYIKGGELREFQMKGLYFLALNWTRGNNVILADEMGLGKTVQTVSFLSWLRNDRRQEGPFLVVAPLSVIPAWCDTFNHWAPDINYVVYLGPEAARMTIREYELIDGGNSKKPKFNVLVTSYDFILQDWEFLKTIKWQVLAVDEAHRLKNRDSQLYAKLVSFAVPCRILITGTPIQNNLAELSALLDFLNPGKVLIDEELELLGQAEIKEQDEEKDEEKRRETQAKLQQLHAAIAPYILRRTKETVESDLPPKTEKIIRVELSDVQLEYYKNILTRNYAALSDASGGQKQSLLNVMMELKKVSNHPYMFQGVEERVLAGSTRREDQIKGLITSSGKMMLLDQLLAKLRKDNHRVLIFSQMVKMLDILGDYLRVRGYQFQRLDGTIPAGPRRMAINHFNADDSEDFCFLLSTRAGGLGINLMTADTVIIYDSDWNPQADLQAMARAHRIGQKRPVNVYRLVAKQTIEEEVIKRARNKLFLEYLTIQAGVTDEGKALREQFREKGLKMDEAKTAEDIQWILKMRSQNLFEQSGNQEKLEQLDIDAILENAEVTKTNVDDKLNLSSGGIDWDNWMQVTDVKVDELALDWDQIIPAEQLVAIKADEQKKKHDEYLTKTLEENAPRKATLKGSRKNPESERAERLAKKRQREKQEQDEQEERRAQLRDPRRPLNEKETRNLVRALYRYGSIDDRGDDVLYEARLSDRDRDFIRSLIDDLVAASQIAVDANHAKLRDEEEKSGKTLAKKDKKAVLIDFGELRKVNAETIIERPPQLRLLRKVITEHGNNKTFRLADATKSAHYSCEWGAREDGMLLLGIDKYGFGAWAQIRDDPELDMQDKFFLEEHRVEKKEERKKGDDKSIPSPGAVHIVRRSEYLLSVLLAKHSDDLTAQRAVDNHHRSKKGAINGHKRNDVGGSASASPAPQLVKRQNQTKDRNRERHHSSHGEHNRSQSNGGDRGTPRPDKRKHDNDHDDRNRKHRRLGEHDGRDGNNGQPEGKHHKDHGKDKEKRKKLDAETLEELRRSQGRAVKRFEELMKLDDNKLDYADDEQVMWSLLKPVRTNFQRIMNTTPDRVEKAKERAAIMGQELRSIGSCLNDLKKNQAVPAEKLDALMPRFWDFLSSIWPVNDFAVSGKQLAKMYEALRAKDDKTPKGDEKPGRDDLEDGEIDSEREARHESRRERDRDYRRDDDHRREGRRDDRREDPSRRIYPVENGERDRLSFRKERREPDRDRDRDRGRSSWHGRNSPY